MIKAKAGMWVKIKSERNPTVDLHNWPKLGILSLIGDINVHSFNDVDFLVFNTNSKEKNLHLRDYFHYPDDAIFELLPYPPPTEWYEYENL